MKITIKQLKTIIKEELQKEASGYSQYKDPQSVKRTIVAIDDKLEELVVSIRSLYNNLPDEHKQIMSMLQNIDNARKSNMSLVKKV